jgi:hypothetical protein
VSAQIFMHASRANLIAFARAKKPGGGVVPINLGKKGQGGGKKG